MTDEVVEAVIALLRGPHTLCAYRISGGEWKTLVVPAGETVEVHAPKGEFAQVRVPGHIYPITPLKIDSNSSWLVETLEGGTINIVYDK